MEKGKLLTILSSDIDEIKAHLDQISNVNHVLHQLDKDLLLQKTRLLYDNILKFEPSIVVEKEKDKVPESTISFEVKSTVKEEIEKKEKIEAKENIFEFREEPEEIIENEESLEEVSFDEIEESLEIEVSEVEEVAFEEEIVVQGSPIKEDILEEESTEEKLIEEETTDEVIKESSFDLFSVNKETVSDKFVGKDETSLADKLQQKQLDDLRTAIGINEKFLFINELFNGDMGRYNKALDELNSMQSKNGIDTFLMELKIEKQWNVEMEAYIKFKELIDRKFF